MICCQRTELSFHRILLITLIAATGFSSGCATSRPASDVVTKRILPSNDRNWIPEMSRLTTAEISGSRYRIRNIRNNQYVSNTDFVPSYYDREIDLSQIQSVDYIVAPFNNQPDLAHTMLSFGVDDGSYITVSAEVRKEIGENYSVIKGFGREYEIMYVVGDEKDLIRLRTAHRDTDVYIYPTVANANQAQQLFVSVMGRVNKLAAIPEFYNTITNNCTTNIRQHINELSPNRIANAWQVLLPGHSDRYAYDLGLLDQRVPFEDLKAASHVNQLANQFYDSPEFSQRIRSGRSAIERLAHKMQAGDAASQSRAGQYLNSMR